jgi:hypothetical protein
MVIRRTRTLLHLLHTDPNRHDKIINNRSEAEHCPRVDSAYTGCKPEECTICTRKCIAEGHAHSSRSAPRETVGVGGGGICRLVLGEMVSGRYTRLRRPNQFSARSDQYNQAVRLTMESVPHLDLVESKHSGESTKPNQTIDKRKRQSPCCLT